jgi:hypothetical protein
MYDEMATEVNKIKFPLLFDFRMHTSLAIVQIVDRNINFCLYG